MTTLLGPFCGEFYNPTAQVENLNLKLLRQASFATLAFFRHGFP